MFSKPFWSKLSFIFLFALLLFTRFYSLDWASGKYYHPDENNMATAITQLSSSSLDPHFYSYGQFPLYLSYFSLSLFNLSNTFDNAILSLRLYSALFSILSVVFLYLLLKELLPKASKIFFLLLIFTPGLIQLSHFGTTESLLIFVFSLNLYLSLKHYRTQDNKYLLLAIFPSAFGIASKITSLFLCLPLFLSFIFSLKTSKKIPLLLSALSYFFFTLLFSLLLSPYNLINYPDFLSAMKYETTVATGALPVFYTTQFIDTSAYIYQFTHIFPYSSGIIIFLLSLLSLPYLFLKHKLSTIFKKEHLLLILPSLAYFLYFASLFTKWFRFMSPLFFIFPLLLSLSLSSLKKYLLIPLLLLSLFPGLFYFSHYFSPDIRHTASQWFSKQTDQNVLVLSESGNVLNFPSTPTTAEVLNYDFYALPQSSFAAQDLASLVANSEFIIIPSRRVFKNYSNDFYPLTRNYYQSVFSGELGYQLSAIFKPAGDFILNSEAAEETWSVFDRPTIRIYKNTKHLTELEIYPLLYSQN